MTSRFASTPSLELNAGWCSAIAATTIAVALAGGMLVGFRVGEPAEPAPTLGGEAYLRHNLRLGLVLVMLGGLSLGTAALGLAALGFGANGFVIGANLRADGCLATFSRLPHLVPELLGFSLLCGAGLVSAVVAADYIRGGKIRRAAVRHATSHVLLICCGAVCLALAAAIEAAV